MPWRCFRRLLGAAVLGLLIPAPAGAAELVVCTALGPLDGSRIDVSPTLEACVRETDAGGVLELPPGKYTLSRTWRVPKNMTVRTQGKTGAMPACDYVDAADCAELVLRSDDCVMVALDGPATLDHIVINGNKYERLGSLIYSSTRLTAMRCGGIELTSGSRLLNSVVKYVPCRSALIVARGASDVLIAGNRIAFNGFHHRIWADGITVNNASALAITDNLLIDNTDIQMILGGCRNCTISRNEIRHTTSFSGGSFAALILSAMVIEGGRFEGTQVFENEIDCGPYKRCGFGIYYGNEAWNTLETLAHGYAEGWRLGGGSIHDNHVVNAQTGLNLGRTTSAVTVYDNVVESSGGSFTALCGPTLVTRRHSAYNIVPGAILDRTLDTVPTASYANQDWVNCIPNFSEPYGPMDPSEGGLLSSLGAAKVSIACARVTPTGSPVTCVASGSGAIVSGFWTVSGVRYEPCDNRTSCSVGSLATGSYEIQVVAQAPAGTYTSNALTVSVVAGTAAAVSVWCTDAIAAGETAQCIADVSGAADSIRWSADGAPLAGCDNQLACSGTVLQAGVYEVNAVVQTPVGSVTSLPARISVGASPALGVTCSKTATCGPTAVCVTRATVPVSGLFWLVNGARYSPCDNQTRCAGDDLPLGAYTVEVVGRTVSGEVRSALEAFTVP